MESEHTGGEHWTIDLTVASGAEFMTPSSSIIAGIMVANRAVHSNDSLNRLTNEFRAINETVLFL